MMNFCFDYKWTQKILQINAAKKTQLKDKAEGSWLKSDRQRCFEINEILKGTNKRQSNIEKIEAQAWKRFISYQAGPVL